MKPDLLLVRAAPLFLSGLLLPIFAAPPRMATDLRPPNLLWHNPSSGENRVWVMSGTNLVAQAALPPTEPHSAWNLVGSGDFNSDGQSDLVWQNEESGQAQIWLMNGLSRSSIERLPSAPDQNWKMVAVADFDRDGHPDLLWQNTNTAQNVVWVMKGLRVDSKRTIASNGDQNWRIVAAADFNQDGNVDILLRHSATGQMAIWFMKGLEMVSGEFLRSTAGSEARQTDPDWDLAGAGDYNGDGKPDLFWRNGLLGVHACWFLNGAVVTGTAFLSNHDGDPNWRAGGQRMALTSRRLVFHGDTIFLKADVDPTAPSVTLSFSLVANSTFGATVRRRAISETEWKTLVTGLRTNSFRDSTVRSGERYDYQAFREGFGGAPLSTTQHIRVAVNAPAIEERGRAILLVDRTLASDLTSSLSQLKRDLVGDGWSVAQFDVPRQIDDESGQSSALNAANVANVIKPLIRKAFDDSSGRANAVFLIGHVSIPYSGTYSVDGHGVGPPPIGPDHHGAWPADVYYGNLDGVWTDSSANYRNASFPSASNLPGDGKFDQDTVPSPSTLQMAVGRLDFARMPILTQNPPNGMAPRSESTLLNQYLAKDHHFRFNQLPWQTQAGSAGAIAYGYFQDPRDTPVLRVAGLAQLTVSRDPDGLTVGDFFFQRSRPFLWGFLSGSGAIDRINNSQPGLEHTAADLLSPEAAPTTAFSMLLGSFMGDWNLGSNNLLRSLLANPEYGLASMWTRNAYWRLDAMGVGENLGECERLMMNEAESNFSDRSRELDILGDPTLRLLAVAAPSNLHATSRSGKVHLEWSGGDSNARYYVYRSGSEDGPFIRITDNALPSTEYDDNQPETSKSVYMVRALQPCVAAIGSYTNISEGVIASFQ